MKLIVESVDRLSAPAVAKSLRTIGQFWQKRGLVVAAGLHMGRGVAPSVPAFGFFYPCVPGGGGADPPAGTPCCSTASEIEFGTVLVFSNSPSSGRMTKKNAK
jgi:hypothetical protein